ncbi:MAG TPA: restriction endonuclease [Candidatus Bathyarchaeia archaeon]|nr:restriction endonuclease [Candidatus Bathyarchaeia archaeon]
MKEETLRVLTETLKLSKATNRLELVDIASSAKVSESFAKRTLTTALDEADNAWVSLNPRLRIQLALDVARSGRLRDAANVLTWQEFEKLTEECLKEAGFEAKRNVRVKGEGRAWQIDVVGLRGELVLAIDCKHWNTPGHLSRFKMPASHQRHAILHLLATLTNRMTDRNTGLQALPVILTLREPPTQLSADAILVSADRFPNFLSAVTPYDEDLPFIASTPATVENPMSQSS